MEELFLKIILISACVGWCYVDKLTEARQIFDFMPQYYPDKEKHPKINQALRCSYCASGWISFFTVATFWQTFQYWTALLLIVAPCCTMALVGPIIHLNLFYNKINNN